MATLVLSTVGTALGGPVGGAIGALIGQSFDQEVLAPVRRGPRVGDLTVQSSSYGTQIPRMYGSMRVAGSIVWSTDLIESSQTSGAKGQPDVTYSYSVSFAVALSSRPVHAVGRIWADGKLLRGAGGDFKVSTTFRFYDGSEDQIIDPLIGSVEGLGSTPAYRGLALAVFENLELADFGNRIPFLTFEVIADAASPSVATILNDASAGTISCSFDRSLQGYAAYGASIRGAVETLVQCFALDLFDDGSQLRSPLGPEPELIAADEFGCSADRTATPRVQREQAPARTLPAIFRLTYYDPDRDYQTGEVRAVAGEETGNEVKQDLPAVLSASDAKSLAESMIGRVWATGERLTLRLPPGRASLEPGSEVILDLAPRRWTIDKSTVDAFAVIAELRPAYSSTAALVADAGRSIAAADILDGDVTLALFDVPDVFEQSTSQPTVLLAATRSTPGWRRRSIELSYGGQVIATTTARRKSVLGRSLSILANGDAALIDHVASVDVQLFDPDQWLVSCDDEALAGGANLAILGDELIQFGAAVALSAGRFRLSRLLRGRGGTEWASPGHSAGELFCVLERASVAPLPLPDWAAGSMVRVDDRNGTSASITLQLNSVRPPSPVNVSALFEADGALRIDWTRRSRRGWAWIDEIDAPLGETSERYRVTISGTASAADFDAVQSTLSVAAADLLPLGAGPAVIEVRQIGDCATSRPQSCTISLS